MTEEPREELDVGAEEEPQVYGVKKGLTGWKFNRRSFLTATAAATAAVATVKAVRTGDRAEEVAAQPVQVLDDPAETGALHSRPGEQLTKFWRLKNNTNLPWGEGTTLALESAPIQVDKSVPVPNAAPGETVSVQVDLVAPKAGEYQIKAILHASNTLQYDVYLPIVFRPPTATPTATATVTPTPTQTATPTQTCLAESPHPIWRSYDMTWTLANPDPNAAGSRVNFLRVGLSGGDYVYVMDEQGQVYHSLSGNHTNLWSNPVPGAIVKVRLVNKYWNSAYGWGVCVDGIESAAPPPTPTPTRTPCSCHDHCSCDIVVCTCDTIHYWYPN